VSPTPSASPEEIARIKEEWEAKQRKKEQAEKEKKEAEKKAAEEKKDGDEKPKVAPPKPASPAPAASGSTTPKHDKYMLHRQYYTMRLTDHRRRRQKKEVEAVAPRLNGLGHAPSRIG